MSIATLLVFFIISAPSRASTVLSSWYGGTGGTSMSSLNQGRISGISNWGTGSFGCASCNNNLAMYIKGWFSDKETEIQTYGETHDDIHPCAPFNLTNDDCITGFKIYFKSSGSYLSVRGLELYTLNGNQYGCLSPFTDTYPYDTVSYYVDQYNFSYLTGWKASAGAIIGGIQFQFTKANINTSANVPTNNSTNSNTDTNNPTTKPSLSPAAIIREIIIEKNNDKQYQLKYALLVLIITMPFIIFCGYRIKQYMAFVVVDKALILIIGICHFNGDEVSELPGIESNVNDLRGLWFDSYHYTVKICNESTLKCTKRDIIRFIDKYKHLLEDTNYKAVIVHILSHGINGDSFITSDLQTMQTRFFEHELITTTEFAGHPELIKLIFHHACRGHAIYSEDETNEYASNKFSNKFSMELQEIICDKAYGNNEAVHAPFRAVTFKGLLNSKETKEADAHANCAVLYGTIEDRSVSDNGHFTQSICKVFGANCRNPIKRDLYCLIRQIGSDLETKTNNAQICTSKGVGTLRNKIRFRKCTNKIRYRETH